MNDEECIHCTLFDAQPGDAEPLRLAGDLERMNALARDPSGAPHHFRSRVTISTKLGRKEASRPTERPDPVQAIPVVGS